MENLENEKYNGWENRDTWLVALWLNNTQEVYEYVKNNKITIANKMNNKQNARMFLRWLFINFNVRTDRIIYKNVNVQEIKNCILDM